jgi:integrase
MTKAHITDLSMFEFWLKEKSMLSDKSIYCYVNAVKSFLFKNPDIDDINSYNTFLSYMIYKKSGNMYYTALKRFVQYKISDVTKREDLISNFVKPIVKDTITTRAYLTDEKRIDVINNLRFEKHQIIALIQNFTGARAGDILRLKKGRIFYEEDADKKTVIRLDLVGKRKKRINTHIFNPFVQEAIMNYITHPTERTLEEYYFLERGTNQHRPGQLNSELCMVRMNYDWYRIDLKNSLTACGIDEKSFSTHDWRRCFSRNIWEKYKDLQILQRALQHSNPTTTMRYLNQSGLQNKDVLRSFQLGE